MERLTDTAGAQTFRGRAIGGTDRAARGRDSALLLLVEDDAGDALLVEELLSDCGLEAELTWCRTVAEAQEVLADRAGSVCVLLDLHLPDAQGFDGVTRILAGAPHAAVVVLTGLAESEAGLAAVAAGAQDYLVKGRLDPELLNRAVRYALQRKQVEQAASDLQAGRLRAQENARLERGLLPVPLLHTDEVRVTARYEPGRTQSLLGGDFYDVVQTPDGTVHAVIGDVSGHGAAEAALGVCLRVAWRTAVLCGTTGPELARLLEQIAVAERSEAEVFATLTALSLPPGRRSVRVVRAGHHGMLVRSRGEVRWEEPKGGPALGLVPGASHWVESTLPLPADAAVVLFTDGLFEGRVQPDRRLGEEGLLELARRHAALPARAFVDALVDEATAAAAAYGGLADDVAVVQLGWGESAP
uniref:PP2C family protein-serine/threonine phosphatase n=1 Tax=Streptomyces carminius TaxID=2665496 RepID=UPI0038CD30BE